LYGRVQVLGVALKPRPCVMVSAALPPGHRALQHRTEQERLRFWREFGHGTLASDALVCLAMPPAAQGGPPRLVFATVVRRDPEDMAMGPDPMVSGWAAVGWQLGGSCAPPVSCLSQMCVLHCKGLELLLKLQVDWHTTARVTIVSMHPFLAPARRVDCASSHSVCAPSLGQVGLAFEPGPDVESVLQHMGEGPLPGTVLVQVG
jgi:hypothetical protein